MSSGPVQRPAHMSPLDDLTLQRVVEQLRTAGFTNDQGDGSIGKAKGEWLRYLGGLVLAAMIAYFTTLSTMEKAIGKVDERENNHFAEVLRRLDAMQADIREMRRGQ